MTSNVRPLTPAQLRARRSMRAAIDADPHVPYTSTISNSRFLFGCVLDVDAESIVWEVPADVTAV
jgi:hypothetical protein